MGQVYRARDTRLGREVAVKVSQERFSERFEREARAVAALNHPHICTLYDVGPDYLVMELVEGAPVKGPLALEEALRLAGQIAEALAAAHAKGIIHRDLKPGNILVGPAGVKLLDFGLAKFSRDSEAAQDDDTETQTQAGIVLGTAAYMSPEQTGAKTVDARSDIFSFGAVLYEMVSGRRAFRAESSISTMAAILHKEPDALDAPADIVRIVNRCLRKSPAERFQAIAEVREALAQAKAHGEERTPSIAVLPFVNMSADKDNEYFSDGLTEEIINALSKVAGLRTIARTSSFRFRGETDLRKVADALQVATILEGSVRKAGNRLRITAQLINVGNDSPMWADRWDRELADVFDIQDEISHAIVEALKVKLAGREQRPRVERGTANVEAYNAYLQGRYYVLQISAASMARARQCYERAIRLDPAYAAPHAALAEYHYLLGIYGSDSFRAMLPIATAAAERAIELDPGSADAYSARGAFRAHHYEWEAARADFAKALELNPAHALSHFRYALFYLRTFGRNEEAAAAMTRAIESDPLHPHIRCYEVGVLLGAGRNADAVDRARICIETFPSFWAGIWLCAMLLTLAGFPEEALSAVRVASAAHPDNPYLMAAETCALSALGQSESARALLSQLDVLTKQNSFFALTLACAACGDFGRAFDALDRGADESDAFTLFFHDVAPIPGLHEDPRYRAIRRKMKLD